MSELASITAERDEAVKQQKLGWERAAENYRAYEQAMAERDAERTARASLQLALDAIMSAKDDPQRGVIVRLPFNLESLAKNALAFAAKLP
jgi:hypothetical protein